MANNIPTEIQTTPKPNSVVSSNRIPDDIALPSRSPDQNTDPVVSALEGTGDGLKGSYSNPKIIRFPLDISTGQYPHVMQFKVYWRWERKDLAEERSAAKADTQEQISSLEKLRERLDAGQVPATIASRIALGGPDVPYEALTQDPKRARQLIEERITSEQTKLEELNSIGKVGKDQDETLQLQDRISQSIQNTSPLQSSATAAIAAGTVSAAATWLMGGSGRQIAKNGGLAALGAGVGTAALLEGIKALQNEPVYDQMVSLYLPFCTKINNEDSFIYEDTSGTAAIRGLLDAAGGVGNSIDAATQGLEAAATNIQTGGIGTAVSLARGVIVNPRLEKLFKQKDMRNFQFSWELYPRNEDELKAIRELVYTFRYHAHPAKDETVVGTEPSNTQINLRVPAEFAVKFMSYSNRDGKSTFQENPYLPKIARCVITNISVDYTANSVYSSFKNDGPTAVTLTISMSEIAAHTREIVEKGF
jgi:hypothetical protein